MTSPSPAQEAPAPSYASVMRALADVVDPELGMSVVELGLIYGVEIHERHVRVTMTLTAPGCPLHAVLPDWVRAAAASAPGVDDVEISLTFEPPWTADRIRR
jgi:metal-sulfur cluster biosynthetic enzyme